MSMEPDEDIAMESSLTPRFYVLDEAYRLILACPTTPDNPLNHLYDAHCAADALPTGVESIVRMLTLGWDREENPMEVSASILGLSVTVSPLQGPAGRHIAVIITGDAPEWKYEATA